KKTDMENKIIVGNSLLTLQAMPAASIDCVVTSPPYFGQRDYGVQGQIGNEKSPKEYIENLVSIFSECRRVLKENGSLWLNLGDKYDKGNLLGMPWRVALALQDDGWIL